MPEETYQKETFNRVELLVHPLFALENARVKGHAGGVKNVTEKDMLANYQRLGIINSWKRKIDKIRKNPSAIMVIIGPQELEAENPPRYFFEGSLTKQRLLAFSKEYRDLLKYAKQALGQRAIFIRNNLETQENRLMSLLWQKGRVPYKEVRVYAYGEYIGNKNKEYCVEHNLEMLQEILSRIQKSIWKEKAKGVKSMKISAVTTRRGKEYLSIGNQEGLPLLVLTEIQRRLEKKGKISPYFLKFRLNNSDPENNAGRKAAAVKLNEHWKRRKV